MKHCAFCGSPFEPTSDRHRYCRPTCRDADHNRYRLELVRQDRQRRQAEGGTTYAAWAEADAEFSAGGRWAAQQRAQFARDPDAPTLPLPPHLIDPCGIEPPLGYAIDDIGEALGGAGGQRDD